MKTADQQNLAEGIGLKNHHTLWMSLLLALLLASCDEDKDSDPPIVVDSLEDMAEPPMGSVTLRSALAVWAVLW